MFNKLTTQAYISVTESLRQFKQDQRGVTAIEYGLIAFVMGIFVVTILSGERSFIAALQAKFKLLTETVIHAINYT